MVGTACVERRRRLQSETKLSLWKCSEQITSDCEGAHRPLFGLFKFKRLHAVIHFFLANESLGNLKFVEI